ncbi:MAG TPA: MBL fold metallo-hydrolase [Solirubrobacteraceae bacterium]|nr:MBL fold metallo-hydrolase [Solirubrobacteraceae bacterium]
MTKPARKRELGRGERVLPGVFRLRLPLPWPGVPHGNAWAVAAGDGIVLFDTGMHTLTGASSGAHPEGHTQGAHGRQAGEPGSIVQLERALAMCGLSIEDVRLVVCTHAHSDHYGQAATIVRRAGCELWMHPKYEHMSAFVEDPDAAFERRVEVARQSGVPEEPLRRFAAERKDHESGIAAVIAPDRELLPGVVVHTDLGPWTVHETPGHAPSHVCLFQPERRLLISGDHLLGRISLFFDYGYSPDPVGEFLSSLDVVERLGARLCLPGHGRTFTDVHAHIEGNRELAAERLRKALAAIVAQPLTAFELVPRIYEERMPAYSAPWLLTETLAMLTHLEALGHAERIRGEPERWSATEAGRFAADAGRSAAADTPASVERPGASGADHKP